MRADRVTAVGEMTSLGDRKRRAGQRLVIGFHGQAVDDELRKLIREIRPAGFVLFARNVAEPAQVRELNRELVSLCDPHNPPLIAVDQEGGRVQRIKAPATVWPPMRVVGRAKNLTADVSRAMALELRAMGFNLNFAPVADVDSNPKNPVIGDRSFGNRASEVAAHVVAFTKAHQAVGVVACAKHFPGHGDTHTDSHHDLPIVEREVPQLREVELVPFRAAVQAGVGSVMTSHVVYPAWDEDWPATLSARIVPKILRKEWGYDGVVFSDDLEMKAVHGRWTPEQQVERATLAGVDLLLVCHEAPLQEAIFRELVYAQEREAKFEKATITSVARVDALRDRFFRDAPVPDLAAVGAQAHLDLAMRVLAEGDG